MKKVILSMIMLFAFSAITIGCRETKSTEEKIEDGIEKVGDDLEEGVEEIEDEIDDATDDSQ
ncbi:hypothetical protein HCG49_00285 [Arenibacter sp. 6A1]|uniref:hypothetical protein n=1 Tax=Arenibacter sp. 6A1 TaxID=2720391 RepID=UPI001447DA10|nr:hypothetical protein [Arenibacter sp. 6A1]NKI24992.1 hypothetical protein [Arenibacter sp. 6A1]